MKQSGRGRTAVAAAPEGAGAAAGFCVGEQVWARQTWDRAMSPLREALEGRVVYVDPKGQWVTIQGGRYRESFWMDKVHRGPWEKTGGRRKNA